MRLTTRRCPGTQLLPGGSLGVGVQAVLALLTVSLALPAAAESVNASASNRSRGIELFEQHDFAKATTVFLRDLDAHRTDIQALLYLGRIAFEEHRMDAAEKHFERINAIAPANALGYLWL